LLDELAVSVEDEPFEQLIERQLKGFVDALKESGQGRLYKMLLTLVERPLLRIVLQETGGNQLRAASLLGINRNSLRKRIRALGITPPRGKEVNTD